MSSSNHLQIMENPVLLGINIISIVSCLLVFYFGFKAIRPMKTALKLILLISLCDLIICLANLYSLYSPEDGECNVDGFFKIFASWSGMFICSLISLLYYLTIKEFGASTATKLFRAAFVVSIMITAFLALMPVFHLSGFEYRRVDGICKITIDTGSITDYNIIFFVSTRALAYLVATCVTLIAYIHAFSMTRRLSEEIREAYNINSRRLLHYPVAQLMTSTPMIIYNILSTWHTYSYYVVLIAMSVWSLSGFVNFLIYGRLLIQQRRQATPLLKEYHLDSEDEDPRNLYTSSPEFGQIKNGCDSLKTSMQKGLQAGDYSV